MFYYQMEEVKAEAVAEKATKAKKGRGGAKGKDKPGAADTSAGSWGKSARIASSAGESGGR